MCIIQMSEVLLLNKIKFMNTHKVALAVGTFAGLWHLLWSILIVLGLAQPLLDFVFAMHSLNNPYKVMGFSLSSSLGLVFLTFIIGYFVGTVFANIWKSVHK